MRASIGWSCQMDIGAPSAKGDRCRIAQARKLEPVRPWLHRIHARLDGREVEPRRALLGPRCEPNADEPATGVAGDQLRHVPLQNEYLAKLTSTSTLANGLDTVGVRISQFL